MRITLKQNNKFNSIVSNLTRKKPSSQCDVMTKKIISKGLSGDNVKLIECANGTKYIEKSRIYAKLPTSKDFYNYWTIKSKYSLLRELIVNIYLQQTSSVSKFFPRVLDWKITKLENGKTEVSINFEYIKGITIKELFEQNSFDNVPIIKNKKMYVDLFNEFFDNLHSLYTTIGLKYNDLKDDNFIIYFDKNMKPHIKLIDFGRATLPNLGMSTIGNYLLNKKWEFYSLEFLRKIRRNYDTRSIIQVWKDNNKSHKVSGDLKFLAVTIIIGYRKLFNTNIELVDKTDIKKLKTLDYGEQLQYLKKKLDILL